MYFHVTLYHINKHKRLRSGFTSFAYESSLSSSSSYCLYWKPMAEHMMCAHKSTNKSQKACGREAPMPGLYLATPCPHVQPPLSAAFPLWFTQSRKEPAAGDGGWQQCATLSASLTWWVLLQLNGHRMRYAAALENARSAPPPEHNPTLLQKIHK